VFTTNGKNRCPLAVLGCFQSRQLDFDLAELSFGLFFVLPRFSISPAYLTTLALNPLTTLCIREPDIFAAQGTFEEF
jgi:hypothetical protein